MDEKNKVEKRTQSQRRTETRGLLVESACRLFGEQGYVATSLEQIAEDCGLTIRPVYYHFGSKRALFVAVNELVEQRALQALNSGSATDAWQAFLALCEDPGVRQIILEDAPDILSRERWCRVEHLPWAWELGGSTTDRATMSSEQKSMCERVALAVLTEAAMVVMEAGNDASTQEAATRLIARLLPGGSANGQHQDTCPALDRAAACA